MYIVSYPHQKSERKRKKMEQIANFCPVNRERREKEEKEMSPFPSRPISSVDLTVRGRKKKKARASCAVHRE
jgi:hypothetical protein